MTTKFNICTKTARTGTALRAKIAILAAAMIATPMVWSPAQAEDIPAALAAPDTSPNSNLKADKMTTGSVATVVPKRLVDEITSNLLRKLITAKTKREGKAIERQIVKHWRTPPSPDAQRLFSAANGVGRIGDAAMAISMLNLLESKAPFWPEVYSQRAYYKFLGGDYTSALKDINKALSLQPAHFIALAGKYHILTAMKKSDEALEALEIAVAIHPWMDQRNLLKKSERARQSL